MRFLIYGAGVIGCFYGALLSERGYDVTIYARGSRLESLNRLGLRYKSGRVVRRARVRVISQVGNSDCYDFVFLAVRENQLHAALYELRGNASPTIVTMVNSLESYEEWEAICGRGRILPAFPGAGGGFEKDCLDAALTPRIVQPTTYGEIDGRKSRRMEQLAGVFRKCRIPYRIVSDMHTWQLCHLAMVVPIADAYYEAENPAEAGCDWNIMCRTARRIKRNFRAIKTQVEDFQKRGRE
ncbi:MAG: ketopantoate reductase family protein [Lachnospiraceae bacterium]|nr:ketopantoate reductase family protein [Lachnospiraceae bacterium]